jgi:hypothetical protein
VTARNALLGGVAGLLLWLIGLHADAREALNAWLFAFSVLATVLAGTIFQIAVSYLTRANWYVVMRRFGAAVIGATPLLMLLALPLLLGLSRLYPWAAPQPLPRDIAAAVRAKGAWLTPLWFLVRTLVYTAIWVAIAEWLRRNMLAQDEADTAAIVAITRRLRRGSAAIAVVMAIVLSFAAFDWLMSLDPTWHSTIFGVYVFAGGYLAALALNAPAIVWLSRSSQVVRAAVTASQRSKLGTLTFAFVIFWAYIAFSQFLVIWIGNIPADAHWYVARGRGGWGAFAILVLLGEFAVPFTALLWRRVKRQSFALAVIGAWIVVLHILDIYWLVIPALHPAAVHVSWMDAAALLAVSGFALAMGAWRMRRVSWVPVGDPDLDAVLPAPGG